MFVSRFVTPSKTKVQIIELTTALRRDLPRHTGETRRRKFEAPESPLPSTPITLLHHTVQKPAPFERAGGVFPFLFREVKEVTQMFHDRVGSNSDALEAAW